MSNDTNDTRYLYMHNPHFHALAHTARQILSEGHLTSDEIRRAVMYGAELYLSTALPPHYVRREPPPEES